MSKSKSIVLKHSLESGCPGPDDFDITETSAPTAADLNEGDVLVALLVISADPYMRGMLRTAGSVPPGGIMPGFVGGEIIESKNDKWKVGDLFGARLPYTTVQVVSKQYMEENSFWNLNGLVTKDQMGHAIGILGMPGSTAYGGLCGVLRPLEGETIWVSGAGGAVGSLVGQIAKKIYNCKVIGSAGGPEKCKRLVEQYGFDYAVDYKKANSAEDLEEMVREYSPDGINMYFDNVGGIHFDAAFKLLKPKGRIAICGGISHYNEAKPAGNLIFPTSMIYTNLRIEGFVCAPWLKSGEYLEPMAKWRSQFVVDETVFDGVEQWPSAFRALFTGENVGKVVVKV